MAFLLFFNAQSFSQALWQPIGASSMYMLRKVGVNTGNPLYPLDVKGNIHAINTYIDSLSQAGKMIANQTEFATAVVTGQITAGSLIVNGNATISGQLTTSSITSSSGIISFGNTNLSTAGDVNSGNISSLDSSVSNQQTQISNLSSQLAGIHQTQWTTNPDSSISFNGNVFVNSLNAQSNISIGNFRFSNGGGATPPLPAPIKDSIQTPHPMVLASAAQTIAMIADTVQVGSFVAVAPVAAGTGQLSVLGNISASGSITSNALSVSGQTQFDSVKVASKMKLGNSLFVTGVNASDATLNELYTDNNGDANLYIQSSPAAATPPHAYNHHTIIGYNSAGNTGIGTNAPEKKLHVLTSHTTCASCPPLTHEGIRMEEQTYFSDLNSTATSVWDLQPFGSGFAIKRPNENPKMFIAAGGNVGIGTTNPQAKLEVQGSVSIFDGDGNTSLFFGRESVPAGVLGKWGIQYVEPGVISPQSSGGLNFWIPSGGNNQFGNNYLFLADNGNVGIGTTSPATKLDVNGSINVSAGSQFLVDGVPLTFAQWQQSGNDVYYNAGNVAIGTTPQAGYKLVVCGTIRTHRVVVETFTCDFVFDKNYSLLSLQERRKKVLKSKHLLNVSSAKEMDEKGNDLGNTTMGILQNVEEHELYLYQHDEKLQLLEQKNTQLMEQISAQQKILEHQGKVLEELKKKRKSE